MITMNKKGIAGNHGDRIRSDCRVEVELREKGGIEILLESKVERMFGPQIRKQTATVLADLGLKDARVRIQDSGALPFVLAARLEAAVKQVKDVDQGHVPEMIPQNSYESKAERSRFSRLYLPGNTPAMMLNAGIHHPDGIILDLEDSVAPERKPEARLLVRNALCQVDFYGCERMVRINQLPMGLEDLEYVVAYGLHLILIPKCESAEQVRKVDARTREILKTAGQDREIYLMPIIESCLGVEMAYEMATASERVVAMAIGLEDYTADLGVPRTEGGEESLYARTRLVNACKAAGIQPIDSVYSDVGNMEGLLENVRRSRSLGFEGMGCIHPRQVNLIHQGFAPTEAEVEKAEKIVAAFEEAKARGLGVVALGTKMIDPPVIKRALHTLELHKQFK